MNIQTVADNLRSTIAGKEALLKSIQAKSRQHGGVDAMVSGATIGFLEVNIDELKRILQDVETCIVDYDDLKEDLKETNGRVRQLERENSDMGWQINPDRMGL